MFRVPESRSILHRCEDERTSEAGIEPKGARHTCTRAFGISAQDRMYSNWSTIRSRRSSTVRCKTASSSTAKSCGGANAVVSGTPMVACLRRVPARSRTRLASGSGSTTGSRLRRRRVLSSLILTLSWVRRLIAAGCWASSRTRRPATESGCTRAAMAGCWPCPGGPGLRAGEPRLLRCLGFRPRRRVLRPVHRPPQRLAG